MNLLHIDSSITGAQSVSRQLSASVVARLAAITPGLSVVYRDLAVAPVPQQSQDLLFARLKASYDAGALAGEVAEGVAAAVRGGAQVTPAGRDAAARADVVLEEFLAADIVVVGAPMYNFGPPSQLKDWLDCLCVMGRTFRYSASGIEGLAGGRSVIIASSRGGIYSAPSPMAAMDHQESLLATVFGFLGVRDISYVRAEGVNLGPEQRQRAIADALAEVAALKAA
ncbi:FMN-dependent NADH-azoreductase [Azorhizobium doebereinerae]|uniref:FMN-dependent NADH-azoreductase n=1 Tax=Azorhizobium doebereinerae TaxID=281091 RepID=UPI0004119DD6|nr:NAD(P)H-dependent oxidoreductase [Azorhizobium doebereinerae]